MKYVVLGAGLQGPAVAHGLSTLKSNAEIWLVEKDSARLDRAKWLLKKLEVENVISLKINDNMPVLDSFRNVKELVVVSTLPYKMNQGIAIQCMKMGWRYYDLGGHFQTSEKIALTALSKNSSVPVMTDLGLAPGLVNLLGEYAMTQLEQPDALQMFAGGLPFDPTINELNYGVVFNTQGLVNEYFNECKALINGKICKVEPMGDYATLTIAGQDYEAFNTSGGAHTTLEVAQQKELTYCSYKTIRHFGHCKVMRFLKNDVGMITEQIGALIEEKITKITKDRVLIAIALKNRLGANYLLDFEIAFNENFTAMQRATGYSVAGIVVQTENIHDKPILNYTDVDTKELVAKLNKKLLPEIEL